MGLPSARNAPCIHRWFRGLFYASFVNKQYYRVPPMEPIECDHTIAAFQQLQAVESVHIIAVLDTFRADGSGTVHYHNAERVVTGKVEERLAQYASLGNIVVAQTVNQIQYLNHPRLCFVVQIESNLWQVDLNVLLRLIRCWEVALRKVSGFLIGHRTKRCLRRRWTKRKLEEKYYVVCSPRDAKRC